MPNSVEGKVSLVEDYNTTDDESDNESVPVSVSESNKKSIFDIFGVKSSKDEKCSKCVEGYTNNNSIYYAKDKAQNESILMINKDGNEYLVQNLNLSGVYGEKAKNKFKSLEELNKTYPTLKVIPNIKKYYSMDGRALIAGEDIIPKDGLIVKELPDYKGVGLEEPRLVGGKKSRKSRRPRKSKKSRKSRKNK
jgi:hypothetical protein